MIKQNKKGFVILYAVIISTVVLIVGVSLMNIMTKQLVLSSISRSAKVSYYAAQAGRDCAEFWKENQAMGGDNHFGGMKIDSETGTVTFEDAPYGEQTIKCLGTTPTKFTPENIGGVFRSEFSFTMDVGDNQKVCAMVRVDTKDDTCSFSIVADGYNISCEDYKANKRPPRLVKSTYRNTCE